MVDKLGHIGAFGNASERSDKVNKKIKAQEAKHAKLSPKDTKKVSNAAASNDQVQFSQKAKEMMKLRAEAERYLQIVKEKETLSSEELEKIKMKLENNHYLKEEVIDKIIEKLLNLSNFRNL